MSTEVTTPIDLREKVAERIRLAFLDLVPEDQWRKLVDAEIKRFFQTQDRYVSSSSMSPFAQVVWKELATYTEQFVRAELAKPDFFEGYDANGNPIIGKIITDYLEKNSDKMIKGFIQQAAVDAARGIQYAIENQLRSLTATR